MKKRGLITQIPRDSRTLMMVSKEWDITDDMRRCLCDRTEQGLMILFLCVSRTRGKNYPKCEICFLRPDGSPLYETMKQPVMGSLELGMLERQTVPLDLMRFPGTRDEFITYLYRNETWKLTQLFLAAVFGLTQSRISQILRKQGIHPKR